MTEQTTLRQLGDQHVGRVFQFSAWGEAVLCVIDAVEHSGDGDILLDTHEWGATGVAREGHLGWGSSSDLAVTVFDPMERPPMSRAEIDAELDSRVVVLGRTDA
jgi:hypothetical protein